MPNEENLASLIVKGKRKIRLDELYFAFQSATLFWIK